MESGAGPIPYDGQRFGRERCEGSVLPRHRHGFGYMCVVLSGHFVEAGDEGRFRAEAGSVLVHRSYEAHRDLFGAQGAEVLNLPLPDEFAGAGQVRIADVDSVARLAERDPWAAAAMIGADHVADSGEQDWPDLLAAALRALPALAIGDWAHRHRLAPATVSRGFRQAYGVSPARYRAETRALRSWRAVSSTRRPLADIAFELGFADQAHMTRAFAGVTGLPPRRWRSTHQMRSRSGVRAPLG